MGMHTDFRLVELMTQPTVGDGDKIGQTVG